MTVAKLSQIALSPSNLTMTDHIVGVTAGGVDYLYTGSQIQAIGRILIVANTNYYVATTGNDSNDGSIGSPWATLQHAMNYISSVLDIGGFTIFVNIGAGSFVGLEIQSTVGSGIVQFNGAGSASTSITAGAAGPCVRNVVACNSVVAFNSLTFKNPNGHFIYEESIALVLFVFGDAAFVVPSDLIYDCSAFGHGGIGNMGAGQSSFLSSTGNHTLVGPSWFEAFNIALSSAMVMFGTWTISGTPSIDIAFISMTDSSSLQAGNQTGATFTGAATGRPFLLTQGGQIDTLGAGLAYFPGSLSGLCDPSSSYDGSAVPLTVADLNTNFPPASYSGARMFVSDSNATIVAGLGNIVAGTGGNKVPVYSDGTNWLIG